MTAPTIPANENARLRFALKRIEAQTYQDIDTTPCIGKLWLRRIVQEALREPVKGPKSMHKPTIPKGWRQLRVGEKPVAGVKLWSQALKRWLVIRFALSPVCKGETIIRRARAGKGR